MQFADIKAECAILYLAAQRQARLDELLERCTEKDFTLPDTATVFRTMQAMAKKDEDVSMQTLIYHLTEMQAQGLGRNLTFSQISQMAVFDPEFPSYLARTKEMTARRQLYRMADTVKGMLDRDGESEAARAVVEQYNVESSSTGMKRTHLGPKDMAESMVQAFHDRADPDKRASKVLYSSFGLLNAVSGGFEKGDLIILSAESGAGKSAFAMNLAYGIGILNKRPVLYLNSEMSTEQMALRWASFLSKVSHSALRNGNAADREPDIEQCAETMKNGKLETTNIPDMQIQSVIAEVRRQKAASGIEMAIVDYIGRMDSIGRKDVAEWQVFLDGARRLKTLAMEQGIAVLMVAQLSSDGGRLAQGSYMKHEADLWLNISHIPDEKQQQTAPWNCTLEFRKARNVGRGHQLPLRFSGDTLTFTDDENEARSLMEKEPPKFTKGDVPL